MKKNKARMSLANKFLSDAIASGDLAGLNQALSQGADVRHKDSVGWTWVMQAAAASNKPDIMDALLEAGADLDARNGRGGTGAMVCVENGNVGCLGILIRRGADLDAKNEEGRSAIIKAALNKETACGKALLAAGASPNTIDSGKNTAYLLAAQNGLVEFMLALFDAGADIEARDFQGWTASRLAAAHGRPEAAALAQALALSRREAASLRAAVPSPARACVVARRRI